jgi:hypothetical protein
MGHEAQPTRRANRVLIALAAAWIAIALAIGGAAAEVPSAGSVPPASAADADRH